jgi:hypothetical protein
LEYQQLTLHLSSFSGLAAIQAEGLSELFEIEFSLFPWASADFFPGEGKNLHLSEKQQKGFYLSQKSL